VREGMKLFSDWPTFPQVGFLLFLPLSPLFPLSFPSFPLSFLRFPIGNAEIAPFFVHFTEK
jgi:hypothetical protein